MTKITTSREEALAYVTGLLDESDLNPINYSSQYCFSDSDYPSSLMFENKPSNKISTG
jgi:hypothetical protein